MRATTRLRICQSYVQDLPTELWLQILENVSIHEAEHLWMSVRRVSRQFRDYVERLFVSYYLPQFAISLSLPLRNTSSGTQRCWPGTIPKAQIVMSYDHTTPDRRFATFVSPLELEDGNDKTSVEVLRASGVLTKARLLEAPAWVYTSKNYMAGRPLQLPIDIEWEEARKRWIWPVEWMKLISRFYQAKMEARMQHQSYHAKRRRAKKHPL